MWADSEVETSGPLSSALTPGHRCTCDASGSSACCSFCIATQGDAPKETATFLIQERTAMILGMNPHTLRQPREWNLFLWPKRRHWVLVVQPAGPAFDARIVDDFVHNAQYCFNTEVPSSRFFLVYELLVEQGGLFLMLSVKPDFDTEFSGVIPLGRCGPMVVEELQEHAIGVVRRYRSYSYIGCNCQHFASDLALSLGAPRRKLPEDEATAVAHAASDGAAAFSVAGVTIAATAAVGAGCASAVGASAPCAAATMLGAVPVVLSTVAVTATAVGLGGGLALIGIAGGYKILYDRLREADECEHACCEGKCAADRGAGRTGGRTRPGAAGLPPFSGQPLPMAWEDRVEHLEDSDPAASPHDTQESSCDDLEFEAADGGASEEHPSTWALACAETRAFLPLEPVTHWEKEESGPEEDGDNCAVHCAKDVLTGRQDRPRAHSADAAAGSL